MKVNNFLKIAKQIIIFGAFLFGSICVNAIGTKDIIQNISKKASVGEIFTVSGIRYEVKSESVGAFVVSVARNATDYAGNITIPAIVNHNGNDYMVTSFETGVFYLCTSLNSVTIPSSISIIPADTFRNCTALVSVSLPNSITSIGDRAFSGCTSLASILIPNAVTTIGDSAFSSCSSFTNVLIPNSVTTIGVSAFSDCSSLTSISLPNLITSIGSNTFGSCTALSNISIPNSVTSIGNRAFYRCTSLAIIIIPNSLTAIATDTFYACFSLTLVTLPNTLTSIGSSAFASCTSLNSISIPNSVTYIGVDSFASCTALNSLTIPNSVTTIDNYAFEYCTALNSVTVNWDTPLTAGLSPFNGVTLSKVKLTVPCGKKAVYQTASVWASFNPIEEQCALGLIENSQNPKTEFFPNPAKDKIIFTEVIKSLEVYASTGQKLEIPFTEKEANISALPKGIYILKITGISGEQSSTKLIKE